MCQADSPAPSLVALADIEAMLRDNTGIPGRPALEIVAMEKHVADIRVPYDKSMTRLGGTVSGPVMMAAADAAMYAVIIAHVEHGQYAVTTHLNIEFLRRPEPGDIYARAHLLKLGRRIIPCRVEVFSADRATLVAHVTGAYALMRAPVTSG
ncbi:MAG TPA: PaaI family thioesterase [Salinisphaeraceae bacterium]|nr:PaaI family thioesterase [Salinisphaeraceae bacterium]